MLYAVADTETSGLFDYKKPADAEGQPRMAQLALCVLAEDLSIARHVSFLIRPDGWVMEDGEALEKHGLSHARLEAEGVPIAEALAAYNELLDGGHTVVGFNVAFDLKMLRAELRRAGLPDRYLTTQSIDCMRPMANVIKAATGAKYKPPKLVEAYAHWFPGGFDGAHDALADARATAAIFAHLVQSGELNPLEALAVIKGAT